MDKLSITNKTKKEKFEINSNVKINASFISKIMDDTIKEYKKYANINGFRKGNAPDKLIFEKYKDKIINDAYNQIKEDISEEIYKKEKSALRIIINKEFKDLLESREDINIDVTIYLKPEINKIDLKKINIPIKKAEDEFIKQKEKYNKEEKIQIEENKTQYINNIYDNLIMDQLKEKIKLDKSDIPLFIIDSYVNYSLDKISEFTKSINMDIGEYFKQIGKSREDIIEQLEKEAIDQFKFDLFIEKYALENKIEVTKEDIDHKMSTIDPKQISQINTNAIINDIIYSKSIDNIISSIKSNAANTNSN
ncbi:hypothetical protein M1145_02095 [Patescibacteria group bacterium]|nr:hypothetical protein [Patescibacteria group bacterium]